MLASMTRIKFPFAHADPDALCSLLMLRSLPALLQASARVYIQALDETTQEILTMPTSLPSIRSLVGKAMREVSDLTILGISEAAPTGSAVYTISSVAAVFFDIKGHFDIDVEISRAMAKLQKAMGAVNHQKVMAIPDYQDKVSDAVKEGDKEKLRVAETEVGNLQHSIEQFEQLNYSLEILW
ncbi:hypothetical protein HBH53_226370 [Parastagonospora nodorum]|nr:hypothetical protein HBH53_226370 [Parastagonospora nodorum]